MSSSNESPAACEVILFRLRGIPIYQGTLAILLRDPEKVGIVFDHLWDQEAQTHLVHFLLDGQVILVTRSDIRLP